MEGLNLVQRLALKGVLNSGLLDDLSGVEEFVSSVIKAQELREGEYRCAGMLVQGSGTKAPEIEVAFVAMDKDDFITRIISRERLSVFIKNLIKDVKL